MTNLKHITYVINPTTMAQYSATEMRDLCTANQASNSSVGTVCELFPLLSNPNFTTDLIAIDINQSYLTAGISIFDITNTLNTLIKSTVSRAGSDRPLRRTTKIFFYNENTQYDLATEAFLIKNSFGTLWGDNGYAIIPFRYVEQYGFEMWNFSIGEQTAHQH